MKSRERWNPSPSDEATLDHGVMMEMPLREFVERVVGQLGQPLAAKRRAQYQAKWRRRMGLRPLRPSVARHWWEQEYGTRPRKYIEGEFSNE